MNVDEGWWFNKIEEPLEKLVEQESAKACTF